MIWYNEVALVNRNNTSSNLEFNLGEKKFRKFALFCEEDNLDIPLPQKPENKSPRRARSILFYTKVPKTISLVIVAAESENK